MSAPNIFIPAEEKERAGEADSPVVTPKTHEEATEALYAHDASTPTSKVVKLVKKSDVLFARAPYDKEVRADISAIIASLSGRHTDAGLEIIKKLDIEHFSQEERAVMFNSVSNFKDLDLAKALLEIGLDPNERNAAGKNAFITSAEQGDKEMTKLLIQFGRIIGFEGPSLKEFLIHLIETDSIMVRNVADTPSEFAHAPRVGIAPAFLRIFSSGESVNTWLETYRADEITKGAIRHELQTRFNTNFLETGVAAATEVADSKKSEISIDSPGRAPTRASPRTTRQLDNKASGCCSIS